MERRLKNWGTLAYTVRATTRQHPLHRSSPNLLTSSRSLLVDDFNDDNDDYGFITKTPPIIPPPPRPQTPLEFDDEYQKRVKEYQNNLYWENIKHRLTQYYNHRHETTSAKSSSRSGIINVNNSTMETNTKFKKTRQQQPTITVTQSVPVQSSVELDEIGIGRIRRDSGSTLDLLEQVCEVQDCCERLEDFENEEDTRESEKVSRLCVKCLVRYYNRVGPDNERSDSRMSRVSQK
jgi:hypothetical protein